MSKLNVSKGNMYDWVTHMWSPLVGCPHQCSYCYVRNRFRDLPAVPEIRRPFPELGGGKTIFIGHLCDLFAEGIDDAVINEVLLHCWARPNTYVFQTKNPARVSDFKLPVGAMVGTTIETNRGDVLKQFSRAPDPIKRSMGLSLLAGPKFLTIEPIMDFDLHVLVALVASARPDFVNIGADSKRHNLPEPTWGKVMDLVEGLEAASITVRKKVNLDRLMRASC